MTVSPIIAARCFTCRLVISKVQKLDLAFITVLSSIEVFLLDRPFIELRVDKAVLPFLSHETLGILNRALAEGHNFEPRRRAWCC